MTGIRFLISGKVQGVFFRASTREEALRLGLCGHARNLDDGRVEVVVSGDRSALQELERWLWQGPSAARVDEVILSEDDAPAREGFLIF